MNTRIRVVVVEDSVADMEIDMLALKSAGFDVDAVRVETEHAYLDAIERKRPDVILSDHSMPRFDAHRALQLLRDSGSDIPFILVSGKIGERAAVELMKSGANDYVIKSELARLAPAVRREIRAHEKRRRAQETSRRLAERERTLENLMQNLPGMVYRLYPLDGDWRFEFASAAATDLTGYRPDSLMADGGMSFRKLVFEDHEGLQDADILASLEKAGEFSEEHRIVTHDGDVKWVWHRATAVRSDDGVMRFIEGFIADITTQKINQARLTYLAHHDVLTGLANRAMFEDELSTTVARAERLGACFSLFFIDLDDFKDINDSSGHAAGDSLLCSVSERLMQVARQSDGVARLGGDEFAVLADIGSSTQDAATVAERILEELSRPYRIEDQDVRISASIGIATYPEDGRNAAELLSNADAAMYSAKQAGRNTFRFFASEMNTRARDLVEMRALIPVAIQDNQFELHYQPQVRLDDGSIAGVEALLRWEHPHRGFISAGQFIPVAEEGGLIGQVDRWVMREAFRQARLWRDAGMKFGRLSFNLSARQFHEPGLAELLRKNFAEFSIEPGWFELEVTETAMMLDVESAQSILEELRELGITITIDDFGKGYSSLSYLKRFAVDRLKIDKAFVSDLPGDDDDLQICRSIIALAGSMDIEVVAEGIETAEQAAVLLENGCRIGQGYHFARPASAAAFAEYRHDHDG